MIEDSQLNFTSGDLNLAKKILMEVLKEKSLNILTKAVALRYYPQFSEIISSFTIIFILEFMENI